MKKLIYILTLFLSIAFTNYAQAGSTDTSKVEVKLNSGVQQKLLIEQLTSCFSENNFDKLPRFCNGSIIFTVFVESKAKEDTISCYKAADLLNYIFSNYNYVRFKMLGGKNKENDTMLVVQTALYDDSDKNIINTSFILDDKGFIKAIAIY